MVKRVFYTVLLLLSAGYSLYRVEALPWLYASFAVVFLGSLVAYLIWVKFKAGLVIWLGLAFVFLDLALNKVNWNFVVLFVKDINWLFAPAIVAAIFVNMSIRSLKWGILFPRRPEEKHLFSATFIGFMANTIFPARAGEFIRAFIIADKTGLSKSQCLTTIFLERLMDGLALMTFFIILLVAAPLDRSKFLVYGILAVAIYLAILALFVLFYFFKPQFEKILLRLAAKFMPRFKDRIKTILNKAYEGLHLFRNIKSLVVFFLLTLLNWSVILFTIFLIDRSVNLLPLFQIPGISWFYSSLFVLIMICFAVAIPVGPGGAGPYQNLVLASLFIMNPAIRDSTELISKAGGFSIYIWLIQALPTIIMGVIFWIISGYSIKKLKNASK